MDDKKAGGALTEPPARVWRLLFLHPVRLVSELLAEHTQPWRLAVAAAFGALVGTLPLPGLHTVLVYVGARHLRLNRIMALGCNQLGIPPLVPALCIELGYYLRHRELLTEISFRTLGREAPQRFWEWLLGSLVVGPCLALAAAAAVWLLAVLVQRRLPQTPAPAAEAAGTTRESPPREVDSRDRRSTLIP